jgi:guanylate kinase
MMMMFALHTGTPPLPTANTGRLIVFTGPSGVGKNKILTQLLQQYPERLAYSVSATTRPPRPGEVDGQHYHFINKPQFEARIAQNDFLEHAQYGEHYYGTPLGTIKAWLAQARDVVLEIETQGAIQIMALMEQNPFAPLFSVFIKPPEPALAVLTARLQGRGTETPEQIQKRVNKAVEELTKAPLFQHQLVNETVNETVTQLSRLLGYA